MPGERSRARASGVAVVPDPVEQNDLEKPERQLEVLTPKTLTYVLTLPPREIVIERIEGGKRSRETVMESVTRPIEIQTEFTIGQVLARQVADDLAAFVMVTVLELQRIAPAGDPRTSSLGYLTAAIMRAKPRMMLREFVAQVARYTDAEGDQIERPTVLAIEEGMDAGDLNSIGMFFLTNELEKQRAKKALAEG